MTFAKRLTDSAFALLVASVWLVFYNGRFWTQTVEAMGLSSWTDVSFIAALSLLLLTLHAALLLLLPGRTGMRFGASLLFLVAAACAWFTSRMGTVFNGEMIRNVIETDPAEAADLLTAGFIGHLLLMGVVPAVLLWFVPLKPRSVLRGLQERAGFISVAVVASAASVMLASAGFAVFLRQHKPVRSLLSPAAAIAGTISYLQSESSTTRHPLDPGGPSHRVEPATQMLPAMAAEHPKPLVLVLVIGETARAANFQLNGYARATTPLLSARDDLAYFPDTLACGTSTAVSVPCLFSHLGRAGYSHAEGQRYLNLLDMLQSAGLAVEWRDNNSGCKGVCARVKAPPRDPACVKSHCMDDVLLEDLPQRLAQARTDTVLVLHQIGSHGPAYSERYPDDAEYFSPACRTSRLDTCSIEEVVNAYDNTIRQTDSQLAALLDMLQATSNTIDPVMLYVSDHGESLGENGVYLHGLPYRVAPATQREVPMMLWLSPGYRARSGISPDCLRAGAKPGAASHDNVYHTVMGLLGVRNQTYQPSRDITRPCRNETQSMLATRDHQDQRIPSEGSSGRPRNLRSL